MPASPVRYKRFIEALPKHNYEIKASAIEAGFSESSANDKGKRILKAALKHQTKELVEQSKRPDLTTNETKQLMRDIVGIGQVELMKALRDIALNTRDYASALKVLGPLAKQDGVVLNVEEQNKITVPILNVTVKDKTITTAQQSHDPTPSVDNVDCAT